MSGLLVLLLSVTFWLISIEIPITAVIITGVLASFFLSEKVIAFYYSDEKQNAIINNHTKPGIYRYLVFLIIVLLSIMLMVSFFILSGVVMHQQ